MAPISTLWNASLFLLFISWFILCYVAAVRLLNSSSTFHRVTRFIWLFISLDLVFFIVARGSYNSSFITQSYVAEKSFLILDTCDDMLQLVWGIKQIYVYVYAILSVNTDVCVALFAYVSPCPRVQHMQCKSFFLLKKSSHFFNLSLKLMSPSLGKHNRETSGK